MLYKSNKEDILFIRSALERFYSIGALEDGGVTRLAYSPEEDAMHKAFAEFAAENGFSCHCDAVGNSYAYLDSSGEPFTLIGSHLDSVVDGGRFDGVAGVIAGLLVMRWSQQNGAPLPIRTAAFRCEESSRFGRATIGSGLITHEISSANIRNLTAIDGICISDIFQKRGFSMDPPQISGVRQYLELHIEQGKVLEEYGKQVGIVSAIAGPRRFTLRIIGMAEHSGATPMALRSDALCAASEIILGIEALGRKESAEHSVATVGVIHNTPNVLNVVPGEVTLGIDLRGVSLSSLGRMEASLQALCQSVCRERAVQYEMSPLSMSPPVTMDKTLQQALLSAAGSCGISAMSMISGAGHDAMSFAPLCPTAMVFVPCRRGISHNRLEFTTEEAICTGAQVLYEYLRQK